RQPCKPRELLNHPLERRNLSYDRRGSFSHNSLELWLGGVAPPVVSQNSFGGELNRSQRVLYLVSHPPRNFTPRRGALGLNQIGEIFDDDHEPFDNALGVSQGDRGCRRYKRASVGPSNLQLRMRAVCSPGTPAQRFDFVWISA